MDQLGSDRELMLTRRLHEQALLPSIGFSNDRIRPVRRCLRRRRIWARRCSNLTIREVRIVQPLALNKLELAVKIGNY